MPSNAGEWDCSRLPQGMLKCIVERTSVRKLLLVGCACLRRVGAKYRNLHCEELVDIVARFADQKVSEESLNTSRSAVEAVGEEARARRRVFEGYASFNRIFFFGEALKDYINRPDLRPPTWPDWLPDYIEASQDEIATRGYAALTQPYNHNAASFWSHTQHLSYLLDYVVLKESRFAIADRTGRRVADISDAIWDNAFEAETEAQCDILRCIVGNPFRPTTIHPDWITESIRKLALTIYQDRRFDILPILGDSLQKAGCSSESVIAHCNSPGPHDLGCWVVDSLLNRS
jgi:hypothetical protein